MSLSLDAVFDEVFRVIRPVYAVYGETLLIYGGDLSSASYIFEVDAVVVEVTTSAFELVISGDFSPFALILLRSFITFAKLTRLHFS